MKIISGIVVLIITIYSPLLCFSESTELSSDFRDMTTKPEYKLYAGYPMCSDVLKAEAKEYEMFLKMISSTDSVEQLLKRYQNAYDHFENIFSNTNRYDYMPSSSIAQENSKYSDPPNHLIRVRHRYYRYVGCFSRETRVIELGFESDYVTDRDFIPDAKPTKFTILSATMDNVWEGEFILSSTVSVTKDPRFIKDCWAMVGGVQIGELKDWDGERFKIIEYKGTNGKKTQVKVTPKHRFYSSRTLNGEWLWTRAGGEDFKVDTYLYSDCKGGKCAVTEINESKDPKTSRSRKFWKFFGIKNQPFVYNVMVPETFTYYVGPTIEQKVLVHNAK